MSTNTITAKNLTKQAPASPRHRTGGYAILSRMTDKARADIAGTMGEYHTDCPLDHMLLDWKEDGGGNQSLVGQRGKVHDARPSPERRILRRRMPEVRHRSRQKFDFRLAGSR